MNQSRLHNAILATVLLLYVLITVSYSVINPLFETPDEHFHFFTIHELVSSGELPVMPETYDELLGPEPAQPPLFYILAAPIMAAFDTADAREQVQLNPFAWIGSADAVVNINRSIITEWEVWPWQGYALAGHLIRGLSMLFGLGTLLCVYGSARLVWPENGRFALLSTALIAFLPQFNFINSSISNDALITFLASAGIWQLLRVWQSGVTRRRLVALGVTIGLAALTKNAGFLLMVYAVGFLLALALRDLDFSHNIVKQLGRWGVETAVFLILPVLLIAGWLWVRNHMLYGDFTAANQFIEIAGGDRGYSLWQVLAESDGLWLSFFAVFGWFNVLAPPWVYTIWNGIVLLAVAGGIFAAVLASPQVRKLQRQHETFLEWMQRLLSQSWVLGLLLFGWLLAVYAGLVTFMMQTEAAQGRLLFPAIVPIMLGLAYGISQLRTSVISWGVCAFAFATTIGCLFFVIRPTYALPQTVTTIPPEATPLAETFPDGIELVGALMETETAVSNDIVWTTLYWRINKPTSNQPEFKFEILGRDLEEPIGEIHTYHGRGLYPPNVWPVGEMIADRFPVRLVEAIDAPVLARGFARLVPPDSDESANADEGVFSGSVKVIPAEWPEQSADILARLGDVIEVTAVSTSSNTATQGDTIQIDVTWQTTGTPNQDYATLIHLAPPNQPPLAQGDAHPRGGTYPTRIWAAGEVIEDQYQLTIPASIPDGCYPLWLGMYEVETFARLPLTIDAERQPNDVYQIGDICIGDA
jgi:4-amino-4-deoxy-L-arabinose transferase-like glycosyltransferase